MPKGFYTQCFCVLTDGSTTLSHIKDALNTGGYEIAKEPDPSPNWEICGDSVMIPYRPHKNGYAVIDVVNRP